MKSLGVVLIVALAVVAVAGFLIFSGGNEQDINDNLNNTEQEVINETSTPPYYIELKSFSFQPKELIIKAGDTVIWTNKDSTSHTVTSNSGNELNSPSLSKESIYSHTFTQTGTFAYHCKPHSNMKGTIIVE